MLNLDFFQQLTQDREDSVRLLNKPSMRGIRASIVEKYSEKAHFIYELLQNADDVGATYVKFLLRKSGLYFIHNGTAHFTVSSPFDIQNIGHINAITAIGDSTKPHENSPKIGKFGIGFKAVFQYTNTPHIYDPHISFKIKDLIVPILLPYEAHPLRQAHETLFFFPFDHSTKSATEALEEIEYKIKNLQLPLIFLNHLKSITWETDNGIYGNFELLENTPLSTSPFEGQLIGLHIQKVAKKSVEQYFLRFSKAVENQQSVQIIYLLENDFQFVNQKKYPAYCFFPTKVMTGLKFLIHAPFLLSDSREGIKQKEKWNEKLIQQIALLLADSFELLAQKEQLDIVNLFQLFPFERQDLDNLFAPLADALLQRLTQKPLLPAFDGSKVFLQNAYLAENQAILHQYSLSILEKIFGIGARWIFANITHHAKFWHTIKSNLTANKTAVTADWLAAQWAKHPDNKPLTNEIITENAIVKTAILQFEIEELFDTIDDETRLNMMKSVEPNAIYAAWEEVRDFDIKGLTQFLNAEMTFERSLELWHFLIQCFENHIFTAENLNGYYTFAYQNEQTIRFETWYWKNLKNAKWLFDAQGVAHYPPSVGAEKLHDAYEQYPLLCQYLFGTQHEEIDRYAYLTDDEKKAIELGKRLLEQGFSTEDLLELRRIKANKILREATETTINVQDFLAKKAKKALQKRTEKSASEENEDISSEALLAKEQTLRDELEAELADKMEQLRIVEELKKAILACEKYSMGWFKALLSLEYWLSFERQEKEKSLQIHFEKVEKEQDTNKTILLKRPSRPFPPYIEEANDIQIKLQLKDERRNLAVEVVSIKDAHLRAKLKTPAELDNLDFSAIRGATLEIRETIFVLEELSKSFNALLHEDDFNVQMNLPKDMRFIFGPPGTGKTTHLVREEILPAMLSDDSLRILVLTPTNKSADVLVRKAQQLYHETPEWLLRFGTTSEVSIENAGLLHDKNYNISEKEHLCVVTTMTRFPYDGFNGGAWDYRLKNIVWDIIIVDEASMINLGYIAYLLMQQPNAQFIIGGDPFQIEPVVFAEDWIAENIYSMVRLDAFDPILQRERMFPNPYKVLNLTTQYRSINTIGALYSHFAYDSILRHHRFKEQQKILKLPNLPLRDINIIRFPSNKLEIIYRPQLLQNSHYHLYSALLTVEIANYISKNLYQENTNELISIGIICPYRAQAALVDKLLASFHLNKKNIRIQAGTIHSFQGDECNVMICLFNPPPNISKSPKSFLNKKNIINVSISRARDYLILLLPDEQTENIDNLFQIRRLEGIVKYYLKGVTRMWTSKEVEKMIFGDSDFLYENTFATTHQSVNVYTKAEKKYEIRIEETAIDVQVNLD